MGRAKKIILISACIAFLVLAMGHFVFAQRELEVGYPEIEGVRPEDTSIGLPSYVKYIFNFSLGIAALIVFLVLIYSGFRYFTSRGNPTVLKDAKNQILAAFLGLAVLVGSYLILTTINPQLVFLRIPERIIFEKEQITEPEPEEKETLFYKEIPLGGLVGEMFSSERLAGIKDVAEKTKNQAEVVKNLSQQLKSLTQKCDCDNCEKGECDPGGCGEGERCNCISYCHCIGGPYGENDPCPNRAAIDAKKEEILGALSDKEDEQGLGYWQKKLEIEINGSRDVGGERIVGLREVYEDLNSAENLTKGCSSSLSKAGRGQVLLGYNSFWEYQQRLLEDKEIKKIEPENLFEYLSPGHPYYLATFYCAEVISLISPESTEVEIGETEGITITEEEERKTFCGPEIPFGKTIDNAEELARRMLVELDNINNNILSEIDTAKNLVNLPDRCNCSNCSSDMDEGECCDCRKCRKCKDCEEETSPSGIPEIPPGGGLHRLLIPSVYAAGCGEHDCGECGCADWKCTRYCCSSCKCVCSGDPCPKEIGSVVSQIENNYTEIAKSFDNLKNLIEEKVAEEELKISKIFENLGASQSQLGPCFNTKETQRKALLGQEKILWQELYSCSNLKEYSQWHVFYDEMGQEIIDCYGPTEESADLLDNYFCCQYEIFW